MFFPSRSMFFYAEKSLTVLPQPAFEQSAEKINTRSAVPPFFCYSALCIRGGWVFAREFLVPQNWQFFGIIDFLKTSTSHFRIHLYIDVHIWIIELIGVIFVEISKCNWLVLRKSGEWKKDPRVFPPLHTLSLLIFPPTFIVGCQFSWDFSIFLSIY